MNGSTRMMSAVGCKNSTRFAPAKMNYGSVTRIHLSAIMKCSSPPSPLSSASWKYMEHAPRHRKIVRARFPEMKTH